MQTTASDVRSDHFLNHSKSPGHFIIAQPRRDDILGHVSRPWSLTACALIVLLALLVALTPGISLSTAQSTATRTVRVLDAGGDAILVMPEACAAGGCPLVVVSHRWGGTPEHALDRVGHPAYSAFLKRFTDAGFALLLSRDGGLETWGNTAALANASSVWTKARALYTFGDTFTLGFSMGGLPASLLGLTGRLPVRGTVTVAAQLSLLDAYTSPTLPARSLSVARAYKLDHHVGPNNAALAAVFFGHDPVGDLRLITTARTIRPNPAWRRVPTLVVASRTDATVDFTANSAAFVALLSKLEPQTRLLEVSGGHLGADHFAPLVADTAITFFKGLGTHPGQPEPKPFAAGKPRVNVQKPNAKASIPPASKPR